MVVGDLEAGDEGRGILVGGRGGDAREEGVELGVRVLVVGNVVDGVLLEPLEDVDVVDAVDGRGVVVQLAAVAAADVVGVVDLGELDAVGGDGDEVEASADVEEGV